MKKIIFIFTILIVSVSLGNSQDLEIVKQNSFHVPLNYDSASFTVKIINADQSDDLNIGLNIQIIKDSGINFSFPNYPYLITVDSNLDLQWQYKYPDKSKPVLIKNITRVDDTTLQAVTIQSNIWSATVPYYKKNFFNIVFLNNEGEVIKQNLDTTKEMLAAENRYFPLKNINPEWSISFFQDTSANIVYNITGTNPVAKAFEHNVIEFNNENLYTITDFEYNYDTIATNNDDFVLIGTKYNDLNMLTGAPVLCYFNASGELIQEVQIDTSLKTSILKVIIKNNTAITYSISQGIYTVALNNFEVKNFKINIDGNKTLIEDMITLPDSNIALSGLVEVNSSYYPFVVELDNHFAIKNKLIVDKALNQTGEYEVLLATNRKSLIWTTFKHNDSVFVYQIKHKETGVDETLNDANANLVIYPNPSEGIIYLGSNRDIIGKPIEIFDVTGGLLFKGTYTGKPIQTDFLNSGSYYLHIGAYNAYFIIRK